MRHIERTPNHFNKLSACYEMLHDDLHHWKIVFESHRRREGMPTKLPQSPRRQKIAKELVSLIGKTLRTLETARVDASLDLYSERELMNPNKPKGKL